MPQGPYLKQTGARKMQQGTPARMTMSMDNAVKSVLGTSLSCYVCRTDVKIDLDMSSDMGIRKIGKKYRRVMFHISCEEKNES